MISCYDLLRRWCYGCVIKIQSTFVFAVYWCGQPVEWCTWTGISRWFLHCAVLDIGNKIKYSLHHVVNQHLLLTNTNHLDLDRARSSHYGRTLKAAVEMLGKCSPPGGGWRAGIWTYGGEEDGAFVRVRLAAVRQCSELRQAKATAR
jgi:hypothetical protein